MLELEIRDLNEVLPHAAPAKYRLAAIASATKMMPSLLKHFCHPCPWLMLEVEIGQLAARKLSTSADLSLRRVLKVRRFHCLFPPDEPELNLQESSKGSCIAIIAYNRSSLALTVIVPAGSQFS